MSHHTEQDKAWKFFCLNVLGNYTLEAVNWSQNLKKDYFMLG